MASTTPKYGSTAHTKLAAHVKALIGMSTRARSSYIKQWDEAEELWRGYVDPNRVDKGGKKLYPYHRDIIIPVTFAIGQTILTYLMGVFTMRSPMFNVWATGGGGAEMITHAKNMEAALDQQMRLGKGVAILYLWFQDAVKYGRGLVQNSWDLKEATHYRSTITVDANGRIRAIQVPITEVDETNVMANVDPYTFYHDPRVSSFNMQDGEFLGHRFYRHVNQLKDDEWTDDNPDGLYTNLEVLMGKDGLEGQLVLKSRSGPLMIDQQQPARLKITGDVDATTREPVYDMPQSDTLGKMLPIDRLEIDLVPERFDLQSKEGSRLGRWLVTMASNEVIVRAEPSPYPGEQYNYFSVEPYGDAYSTGHPGLPQMVNGLQRTIDWLMNSHMENVRKSLNDMLLVDPMLVNMADLRSGKPGRLIRMAKDFWGVPGAMEMAVKQFRVEDVTKLNMKDATMFIEIMQRITAATDIQMGVPSTNRKTFGEVQNLLMQSASRLRLVAQLFSITGVRPMVRQMIANIQEFTSESQYLRREDEPEPKLVTPGDLAGKFELPVTDGATPVNPAHNVDLWKEIFMVVAQQPELAQEIDVAALFKYIAHLAGAGNIDSFLRKKPEDQGGGNGTGSPEELAALQQARVMPDEEVMRQKERGNLVGI